MNRQRNITLVMIGVISTLLIVINYFTIKTVSSIRAYVNGESRYSKGQKDGSSHLIMYIHSGDQMYWNFFTEEVKVPLGDSIARVSLMEGKSETVIRDAFLQGQNHPHDIANMIWLFQNFKNVSFMKQAIQIWKAGDVEVGNLVLLGELARQKVMDPSTTLQEREELILTVEKLTLKLTKLEQDFSDVLGVAARKIDIYLFYSNLFLTLILVGYAGKFTSRMIRKLTVSNQRFSETLYFGKMGSCELHLPSQKLFVSKEMFELLEVKGSKPRHIPLSQFLDMYVQPDAAHTFQQKLKEGIDNPKTFRKVIDVELEMKSATGKQMWMEGKVIFNAEEEALIILHDVTERRKSAEILLLNKRRYKLLYNNIPNMYFVLDRSLHINMVNGFGASQLGYGTFDLMGKSVLAVFPEEVHQMVARQVAECFENPKRVFQWEIEKIKKDGSRITVHETAWIEPGLEGDALLCIICEDVTERKKNEMVKEELLTRFEKLSANIPGFIYEFRLRPDGTFHFPFASKGIRQIYGLSPEEVAKDAKPLFARWHPDDLKKIKKEVERAAKTLTSNATEFRINTPDGKTIWARTNANLERQADGSLIWYGYTADITEQKRIEKDMIALNQSLIDFQNAIQSSSIVSRADVHGTITYVNENFVKISGYTSNELIGQNHRIINSLYHPKSFWIDMWKTIASGNIWRAEVRNKAKNGSYYWVDTFVVPFLDEQGKVKEFLSIRNDITSRKQSEEALSAAREKAEMASQAKSEFLANMSHEIRTPLNGVIGFTDLLMKTNLDPIQSQYMATISQSANGLLDIVNNVLDFSKIEAGKMELATETTDLFTLTSQVIEIVRHQAQQKKIKLMHFYSNELPRFVQADPIRLKQVLVNLLGNAIKFTETGEIELKVEPLERISDNALGNNDRFFRFSVRDTGVGIRPENQEKIFLAFSQEDSSVTKKYGGTGLGLTISNKLLNLMDSQLKLDSKPGRGSKFYFDVKFETVASQPEGVKIRNENNGHDPDVVQLEEAEFANVRGKILIAEDNIVNMTLAKIMIGNIVPHVTLLEATNGQQAVDIFIKEKPDIIFMDVQMPLINGYEASAQIREIEIRNNQSQVPIIALTAGAVQGEKEKCMEAGMNDFVRKPILNDVIRKNLIDWFLKSTSDKHR